MPHHDLPFQAEYAKSGRSACKACKDNISQDSLRLAVMTQSPHFDGKVPNWYHYACFWKRAKCNNVDDIYNYHSLRWEDQEKIKKNVGGSGGGSNDGSGATGGEDFAVEYAKSGKSKCRGCSSFIPKDNVRLGKKEYESLQAQMYGPVVLWHHVDCFVDNRDELEFSTGMDPSIIVGYAKLKPDDKTMLIDKLGKGKKATKRKTDSKDGSDGKKAKTAEEVEEEKNLKDQSKLLWDFRDSLSKNVSNQAMKLMLELNNQQIPPGESRILDAVADCLAFGALDKCNECKDGQLYYTAEGYKCSGNVTEWTKCMNITKAPKRRAMKVPNEFHDVPFLKKYKYVKKERAFPKVTVSATSGLVSSSLDSAEGVSTKPLNDLKFVIVGKLSKSKADLTKEISALGGSVVSSMDKKIAAVISSADEVKKKSKGIKDAEKNDVHVVSEEFIKACQSGSVAKNIESHSIASWGSDAERRIGKRPMKSAGKSGMSARDEAKFTKSLPDKVKISVKGGAAVDPDSGYDDNGHILQHRGEPLTAVLGLVDIERGTNSFYKLQAIELDNKASWYLFRAWGRVGTTIGGNKVERKGSKDSLVSCFKQMFLEKTGNEWDNRKNFQKMPNKFLPLDIDYGQEAEEQSIKKLDAATSTSSLHQSIKEIVCMIFDIESMKKAMMEFEIDMKKMPLGKLSKKHIKSAYSVLTELQKLVTKGGTQTQMVDATNRFYTAIPHDFGMKKPPLLDTVEIIKQKTDMLDNLLEIEVAYSLMQTGDSEKDPVTAHFEKLNCKMEPMDHKSEDYERLESYTKNTHAATHNMYDLEVLDILKVAREGEAQVYRPFKALHNRQLLWHGSRVTNFGGILSQGLRIAPPEAPVTGYMFGKGIYFADMVSKSANYCRASKQDNIGLMMLCEVALGNMYELNGSEYVEKLPKGKHSTKGCGRTCPDPSGTFIDPDGVTIPMGKGTDSGVNRSSLLYNEYIVYDVAQVNIKYLFKMKFNYKW